MIPFAFSFWKAAPGLNGSALIGGNVAGAWLSVGGTSAFAPGTGDFTVEGFEFQTNNGNENYLFNIGADAFGLSFASGGGNKLNMYLGGSRRQASVSATLSTWYHWAFTRSGTTANLYFNGSRIDTFTNSTNLSDTSTLYVGTGVGGGSDQDNWPGNLTNFRLIKGTALYTGATCSVPTSNLTAVSGTSLLLLFSNSGSLLKDSSVNNFTVTNGSAVTWSSATPF